MRGGGYCTVTVYAKHRYSLEDEPVEFKVTTTIEDPAAARAFQDQLREFEAFGTRLDFPESTVIRLAAPGGLGGTFPMAGGSIAALPSAEAQPLRLVSVSPAGAVLASVLFQPPLRTNGPSGGVELSMEYGAGLLTARLRIHPRGSDERRKIDFDFSLGDMVGQPIRPVGELIDFFESATEGCTLQFRAEHGSAPIAATEPLTAALSPFDEAVARYLALLARLQEHAPKVITVPEEIDAAFARELDEVVRMWDGEVVQGTWDDLVLELRPEYSRESLPPALQTGPGHLLVERDEFIEFEGQVIPLGPFYTIFSTATVAEDQPADPRKIRLRPANDRRVTKRQGWIHPTT